MGGYRRRFIGIAFQLYFIIRHYENPGKQGGTEIKWDILPVGLRWYCLELNADRIRYTCMYHHQKAGNIS